MKKAYSKPEIMFESFALSTSIAAGCEQIIDAPSAGSCGIDFGDITIFINNYTGCTGNNGVIVEGDDGSYNGVCYHVPQGLDAQFFNS